MIPLEDVRVFTCILSSYSPSGVPDHCLQGGTSLDAILWTAIRGGVGWGVRLGTPTAPSYIFALELPHILLLCSFLSARPCGLATARPPHTTPSRTQRRL